MALEKLLVCLLTAFPALTFGQTSQQFEQFHNLNRILKDKCGANCPLANPDWTFYGLDVEVRKAWKSHGMIPADKNLSGQMIFNRTFSGQTYLPLHQYESEMGGMSSGGGLYVLNKSGAVLVDFFSLPDVRVRPFSGNSTISVSKRSFEIGFDEFDLTKTPAYQSALNRLNRWSRVKGLEKWLDLVIRALVRMNWLYTPYLVYPHAPGYLSEKLSPDKDIFGGAVLYTSDFGAWLSAPVWNMLFDESSRVGLIVHEGWREANDVFNLGLDDESIQKLTTLVVNEDPTSSNINAFFRYAPVVFSVEEQESRYLENGIRAYLMELEKNVLLIQEKISTLPRLETAKDFYDQLCSKAEAFYNSPIGATPQLREDCVQRRLDEDLPSLDLLLPLTSLLVGESILGDSQVADSEHFLSMNHNRDLLKFYQGPLAVAFLWEKLIQTQEEISKGFSSLKQYEEFCDRLEVLTLLVIGTLEESPAWDLETAHHLREKWTEIELKNLDHQAGLLIKPLRRATDMAQVYALALQANLSRQQLQILLQEGTKDPTLTEFLQRVRKLAYYKGEFLY